MKIEFEATAEELQACFVLLDAGVQNPSVGLKALEAPHASSFVIKFTAAVQAATKPARKRRKEQADG